MAVVWVTLTMFYFYSTTLGPSALKLQPLQKGKSRPAAETQRDKKKKSALDEIIEARSSLMFIFLATFVVTLVLFSSWNTRRSCSLLHIYQLWFNQNFPLCVFQMEERKKKSCKIG